MTPQTGQAVLTGQSVVARTDAQVSTQVESETVLLQLATGTYFSLNSVGARMWEMLEKPCSLSDLAENLVEEYDVELPRAEQDVMKLVSEMISAGFLQEIEQ